ncbi:TetR/AcrR family transcriptional regulator C-terminal domain-containing protein [Amycolatopsis ultiminotia]|uniref:TetR/AcrR family transcriptional regulator C-terminal domain-containing protein n=1 Tax=Amycolatopsis ultiminotia TaxID=543629 RepID=A0ABP6UXP3_9PSEU
MASTEEPALLWTRPEPGTRRPKFTRDGIASAALAIADREGFAAVSMRRVAAELGAGTMTLYYYVRTKDELVALMDDAIMGEVLIPAAEFPDFWYDALTAVAERTWEVLKRHPWAMQALRGVSPGPNAMRHAEQSLAALATTGLDAAAKVTLLGVVDDYVHGNAFRAAEVHAAREAAANEEAAQFARSQFETGEFPHSEALFGGRDGTEVLPEILSGLSERDRFRQGLAMLLDGAAVRLKLALPGN